MKISTTNVRKKDGTKLINGYKICLSKSEVEKNNMGAFTDLVPEFKDGMIILKEVGRLFVDYYFKGRLYCWSYRKIMDNLYDKDNFVFKTGEEDGMKLERLFQGKPLPEGMIDLSKNGNLSLVWDGKRYAQDLNYQ